MIQKKTKIVCTVSDRNCSPQFIESIYREGMNVVRINSAHTTLESSLEIVKNTRIVSDKIAILIDTKGPEIRLTEMNPPEGFKVKKGDTVYFADDVNGISGNFLLYTNYSDFVKDVPAGANILIDDGEIKLIVLEKSRGKLKCVVDNDGVIKGKKSINIPNVSTKLASVTRKDHDFIVWAIENDLDFIAHSFVRSKADLDEINKIIKKHNGHIKVIAKIENKEGVDNIDEIIDNCYGVMVARGDLGVEIEAEKIPVIQRDIINKCHSKHKPVIIATQLLHTMIDNPRPTRAEVNDIASAIFQSTDAIMLSGETANGKYPVESVRTMRTIAMEIEQHMSPCIELQVSNVTWPTAEVLARSLVYATTKLPIKHIVIDTMTGRTGRYVSALRPKVPIHAKCYKPHVMRELALSFGVYSYFVSLVPSKDDFVKESAQKLLDDKMVVKSDMIGVLAGSFGVQAGASFIEVSTIENMIS
jgi:pyruvate kinase